MRTRVSLLCLSLACAAVGCANPTAPTRADLPVDPRLMPAWQMLRTVSPSWSDAPSMDAWVSGAGVRRMEIGAVMAGAAAQQHRGVVTVSPDTLATMETAELAGVLAHEIRHAEGYPHTCGTWKDRTWDEGGAWVAHIEVLRQLGRHASVTYLAGEMFCGPRGDARTWDGHGQH